MRWAGREPATPEPGGDGRAHRLKCSVRLAAEKTEWNWENAEYKNNRPSDLVR